MKFTLFGNKENKSILLIHGMGCDSLYSFSSLIDKLKNNYHIILVSLTGYDEVSNTFISIEEEAKKIYEFINKEYKGYIDIILGFSMGGIISLDLLTKYDIKVNKLILDSGYLRPWNKLSSKIFSNLVAKGFISIINNKDNLFYRLGSKLFMGNTFKKEDLSKFASYLSLYNSLYSCLRYKLININKLNNFNVLYLYGNKERYMKKGMRYLKRYIPSLKEISLGNYGHGELMFNDPIKYSEVAFKVIED